MSDNKRIAAKNKAREIFTEAYNNYKDDPDMIWEYLLVYRKLLHENELI
jgi:hypothetical protein